MNSIRIPWTIFSQKKLNQKVTKEEMIVIVVNEPRPSYYLRHRIFFIEELKIKILYYIYIYIIRIIN